MSAISSAIDGGAPSQGRLLMGVELGGTKCNCILAAGPDSIVDRRRVATTNPTDTLASIEFVLDEWMLSYAPSALGIASFGPLDLKHTSSEFGFITATTKPGWQSTDIARRLGRRYSLPTRIDTDVAGAAMAEGRWGSAVGLASFCYITVGTGVGVGIIADGKVLSGFNHPEAGHMHVARLPGDDWAGACVFHGDCVEGLASGFAIEARAGRPAVTLTASDRVWDTVAHAIAGLCHNLSVTVSPERILIGGGVVMRQPQLLRMIRAYLVRSLAGYGDAPRITEQLESFVDLPGLGDQAGPLGAIALAIDAAKEQPREGTTQT